MTFEQVKDIVYKSSKKEMKEFDDCLHVIRDIMLQTNKPEYAKAVEIAAVALAVWYQAKDVIDFEKIYKS